MSLKNLVATLRAVGGVASKELLHIYRDRRVLVLILLLPPLMTLMFGHAFEVTALNHSPTLLQDRDQSAESGKFIDALSKVQTFAWNTEKGAALPEPDLLHSRMQGALVIPKGWGQSLKTGEPVPLRFILDGSDTTTAGQLQGALGQALGDFQLSSRDDLVENLPEEVIEMGEKLPEPIRKQFVSAMAPWNFQSEILFNPGLRFIDFVMPGIIGLILQLLTVTLMACTITREREAGTLSQLVITSLRRGEIVLGKVLPYLAISTLLIGSSVAVAYFHFHVAFNQPVVISAICLLFLLCSLGMGLLISAFCNTQAQAIQFAVFYLLPVFPLSGAFAPLDQLPASLGWISQTFPLTHFCHAYRLINLQNADLSFITGDLVFLFIGSVITCGGAALLLSREQS